MRRYGGRKDIFPGPYKGYSSQDARLTLPDDEEWQWLTSNMKVFLDTIGRSELYPLLTGDRARGSSSWRSSLMKSIAAHQRRWANSAKKCGIGNWGPVD